MKKFCVFAVILLTGMSFFSPAMAQRAFNFNVVLMKHGIKRMVL